jgi:hypothetical protein
VLWKSILPPSEYLLYFGWETRYGFHDYTPFESAIYKFGDNTIRIDAPPNLKAIRDTAAFYFLTQVKDETIRLNAEVKSSKFLQPSGIAEIDSTSVSSPQRSLTTLATTAAAQARVGPLPRTSLKT